MVGFGYDCHKLSKGEKLILGGINIESEFGTIAHSDGDVVLHALCDALLGAGGLGDIGEHFPDTDEKYEGAESSKFVIEALKMLDEKKYKLINIDITIILEMPKLRPYKLQIKENLSSICGLPIDKVNIKAKTSEKLGFAGRLEGIEAYCVCEIKEVL